MNETGSGNFYFPPPGPGLAHQAQREAAAVGLDPELVSQINQFVQTNRDERIVPEPRWALWRHGYLVHVAGDFDETVDVYSLRKTWHAMIVGAAIKQGKIPSLQQKINVWQTDLSGYHAEATWWHVITQSAGFDYPHGEHPAYKPGEMWTYSDWNLFHLCHALAQVYGKTDFYDDYADVARAAYFDAIGMAGWSTQIVFDEGSQMDDGVRFVLSLEHMGRLGLLVLARGTWQGVELVPQWFVEALESKQTYGMQVNYNGPYDGQIGLDAAQFPECPYGYLTWVNTDGDYFPGADTAWAAGKGLGGSIVLWNRHNGIVFVANGLSMASRSEFPLLIEQGVVSPNPLF